MQKDIISSSIMSSEFTVLDGEGVFARFRDCIPKLTFDLHKGQAGRIGVVGGCKEYTGAPYYAAISSLKAGADLSHVYCLEAAASVIKSYSPELIVHPVLDHPSIEDEVSPWLQKMHSLVVGPGLGRSFSLMSPAKIIVNKAIELGIPLVIDADGIYLVSCDPDLIQGYRSCILTPNWVEFKLLYSRVFGNAVDDKESLPNLVAQLSHRLGHVTVCLKHRQDVISDGHHVVVVKETGSPRRCGGQGDLLAGSAGTFFHWTNQFYRERGGAGVNGGGGGGACGCDGMSMEPSSSHGRNDSSLVVQTEPSPPLLAAYGACLLTKKCNAKSFAARGRSTTTVDLIDSIGSVFMESFET